MLFRYVFLQSFANEVQRKSISFILETKTERKIENHASDL